MPWRDAGTAAQSGHRAATNAPQREWAVVTGTAGERDADPLGSSLSAHAPTPAMPEPTRSLALDRVEQL